MSISNLAILLHIFLRCTLGLVLLSSGISKLFHIEDFQQAIREYQAIPTRLDETLALSRFFSFALPAFEVLFGLALFLNAMLFWSVILIIALFAMYITVLTINLVRGRTDLSCHCGGVLGNHTISWWTVIRNLLLVLLVLSLLFTPGDEFTIERFLSASPTYVTATLNMLLPAMLASISTLVIMVLIKKMREISQS